MMMKSSRRQAASWNPWLAGLSAAVPVALAIAALRPAAATAATAGPAATGRATAAAASQDPGTRQLTPAGTDASCPAATTAGAGSSTVGAPADVRAIGGAASATVVWCPPATGAAKVVSYTVTSSGGQTVTATVPNDWAIVDGLSNGTGYTFTVTANTSPCASGPAATSNSVTPAPITQPRTVLRGKPEQVSYDQYSLKIGGNRVFVTAGEFDPWRTPSPSLWLHDPQEMEGGRHKRRPRFFV